MSANYVPSQISDIQGLAAELAQTVPLPDQDSLGSLYATSRTASNIYRSLTLGWGGQSNALYREPFVYKPLSGTIYVSNSTANGLIVGNDSTGTGTKSNPYLTIDKAQSVVPISGDYLILVNDGTYIENTLSLGFFQPNRAFSNFVSIESYTGNANDVIIQGSGVLFSIRVRTQTASRYQFRHVTISLPYGGAGNVLVNFSPLATGSFGFHFVECIFLINQQPQALTINNATNATPIVITTTAPHGYNDGMPMGAITGVTGNTAANGSYFARVTGYSGTTLALYDTQAHALAGGATGAIAGNGSYISGGVITALNAGTCITWNADISCSDFAFIRCGIGSVGVGMNYPMIMSATPSTLSLSNQPYKNLLMDGCYTLPSSNFTGYGGANQGFNGVTITGNYFHTAVTYGFQLGTDTSGAGNAAGCSNVYLAGNNFSTAGVTAGHALLLGDNVENGIVEFNDIASGLHGCVWKACIDCIGRANRIMVNGASQGSGVYSKASMRATWYWNFVYMTNASVLRASGIKDLADGSNKSVDTTAFGNYIVADGPNNDIMWWGDTTQSAGGALTDYNYYDLRNGARWGIVRGITVNSLAAVRSAWQSSALPGDNPNNDSNSIEITAGERDDISYAGESGSTYYAKFVHSSGQVWDGIGISAPITPFRGAFYLNPSASNATTFVAPVPINLVNGLYTVFIYQRMNKVPSLSDPIVSRQALSYAS